MVESTKLKPEEKISDEALVKISEVDIEDKLKYSDADRSRRTDLLLTERLERYTKDPNTFIEVSEIIACIIRSPFGPMMLIQGTKMELQIGWAELNRRMIDELRRMDLEQAMKNKSMLHKHGDHQIAGGFFNKLRGRK